MSIRKTIFAGLLFSVFSSGYAADIEKGKALAEEVCQACHGADGVSHDPEIPNLAGQSIRYLLGQLGFFRAGVVMHDQMSKIAKELTDADLQNLAEFFTTLPRKEPKGIDYSVVEAGKSIYTEHCESCHGPEAKSSLVPAVPRLASQKPSYTIKQLKAFKAGDRKFPWMRHAVRDLNEDEMKAVASYVGTLR